MARQQPFVFAGRGDGPINGFSKMKARLDRLSGVSGWTVHDLWPHRKIAHVARRCLKPETCRAHYGAQPSSASKEPTTGTAM